MSIRVALHHRTTYRYDRPVSLSPHTVRLRPAPHGRMPVISHSLKVEPAEHFVNWQQDPFSNWAARYVFPKPTRRLEVVMDLVAEIVVVNPFDYFIEPYAEKYPFAYEPALRKQLAPFLELGPLTPRLREMLESVDRSERSPTDLIVDVNQMVQRSLRYLIRMEPGVQDPERTLELGQGSCRDFAWLMVELMRRLGLAARFVSGYSIQLRPDVQSLDGPSGVDQDCADLHAWTEVFLPGAGWVGLDATCGLLAGEGYIPLACTPEPSAAAAVTGLVDECECELDFEMVVRRVHETPRYTRPYTDDQWASIDRAGAQVDRALESQDVRLTLGGEPTFVSIDDPEGAEWNVAAVGPAKRRLSEELVRRMAKRFGGGAPLLHFGQGKWYPGEPLPRWSLAAYWRKDGGSMWRDPGLLAGSTRSLGQDLGTAQRFVERVARWLEVDESCIMPAYEPAPMAPGGVGPASGYVLPLYRKPNPGWVTCRWHTPQGKLVLVPGGSPIGLRLPMDLLMDQEGVTFIFAQDPFEPRDPLPFGSLLTGLAEGEADEGLDLGTRQSRQRVRSHLALAARPQVRATRQGQRVGWTIRTAMAVEARQGVLHVFYPPTLRLEHFLELTEAIENTARELGVQVVLEGYPPPEDHRLQALKVTPDPGVIEVNVQPARGWEELSAIVTGLYEDARQTRLCTEKFNLDGRHTGTGGGNHVVLGGPTPADSPFLRRPDLLRSLLTYWNNHPALSYVFSGAFIGPTSQAPRLDEGRPEALYELEIAFSELPAPGVGRPAPLWMVDRVFRHLLTDMTGNTHRAEFCIDKLYSPDGPTGRLGLLELRSLEMPPHARMSLVQLLLVRALVAWFWREPYRQPLMRWGTALHDRYMLPHFLMDDLRRVVSDLAGAGFALDAQWFAPHVEFRFPQFGEVSYDGVVLELRQALEPWYVLGEEPAGGSTVRFVDSSVERAQVRVSGLFGDRHVVTCNRRRLPLTPTGVPGEWVAGVRYRAWQPAHCLHPTLGVDTPLVIDLLDTWNGRSLGGCTYHVAHPAGRNFTTFPVNAKEAEGRRRARFEPWGHTPGPMPTPALELNGLYPVTLDLRRPR